VVLKVERGPPSGNPRHDFQSWHPLISWVHDDDLLNRERAVFGSGRPDAQVEVGLSGRRQGQETVRADAPRRTHSEVAVSTIRERLEAAYDYARRQLGEASTIRGLILVGGSSSTLAGWISPDKFPAVLLVTGLLLLLLPDDLPWGGK
jgi:hypothetical protein